MKFKTTTFIAIKDDIIVAKYHTSDNIETIKMALIKQKIEYDEIIECKDFEGKKNQNIKLEFDKDLKLRPVSERVKNKCLEIPEGMKLVKEEFIEMTLQEKVDAGLEEMSPEVKIVDNKFEMKTEEELLADGVITQKELDDRKLEEEIAEEKEAILREIAIERIKQRKLKLVKK